MSSFDLSNLHIGDQFECVLALTDVQRKTTRNNDPYLRIKLQNETGSVDVNLWQNQMHILGELTAIRAVRVIGRVKEYKNAPELELFRIDDAGVDHPVLMNLNNVCPIPLEKLMERFEALTAQIIHPGYRLFLDLFLKDGCKWEDYVTAPAAMMNHHAYVHGLFEHHIEVAEIACQLAENPRVAPQVDRSLLIVGALVHDSGKTIEYDWKAGPVRMSEAGLLGNHMVYGPQQVQRTYALHRAELEAAGFTQRDFLLVQHIQMSHHGRKEFGAVVEPRCIEALTIHNADMQSSSSHKMLNALEDGMAGQRDGWVSVGYPFHDLYSTQASANGHGPAQPDLFAGEEA